MPTPRDYSPQSSFLSAVRESQAAVIGVLRTWSDIGQQLTRDLRLPVARVDLAETVDRVFDVAEQTLAVQRQLALTLTGLATRQVDIAVDTAVETVETAVRERARQVQGEWQDRRERVEQPQASTDDTPTTKAESPKQDRRPDGRTYEERSVEELRERAGELQIEGRSSMTKDELIAALRDHRKSTSAKTDTAKSQPPTQDRPADRRTYEDRSIEELRERARELEIEGRSSMTKDELIAALRGQAK